MKGKKIGPGKKIIVVGRHQEGTPTGQYKYLPSDDTAAMLSKSYKPETKGTNMQPVRISKGL